MKQIVVSEVIQEVSGFPRFPFDRWRCCVNGKLTQILISNYSLSTGFILVYWGSIPKQLTLEEYNQIDGDLEQFLNDQLPDAPDWDESDVVSVVSNKHYELLQELKMVEVPPKEPEQITLF